MFWPIIDGWILPQTPLALGDQGADADIPIITGYQANDGLLSGPPSRSAQEFKETARRLYGGMADEFLNLYPAQSDDQARAASLESTQDRERVSMYLWSAGRLKNHTAPVYTYFFDRAIPWPQHPEFGAFHTGEIPYFFRNLGVLDRPWEAIDSRVSNSASSYLREFAINGDPNAHNAPKWPACDRSAPATMEIGARTGLIPLANSARFSFWVRYFHSPESKNAPLF